MDKTLFNTRVSRARDADAVNLAGGKAYALGPREALAQLSVTGCFGDTYYASARDQLDEAKKVLSQNTPEFIAKCAIYARERGHMKDMPAFMLAHLAAQFEPQGADGNGARRAFAAAFPRVIDNGKMLRNFVQVIRSGELGRKSFGTSVRNTMRKWLLERSDRQLFKDQIGEQPSLGDIIKMVRPNPVRGSARWALHEYLLGRKLGEEHNAVMPMVALQYIAFAGLKPEERANVAVPDVDFRLLDSLQLTDAQWKEVFQRANWTMTRMNLNTAQRHNVLKDKAMVQLIADRLRNPELVRKSRDFPFALLAAFIATRDGDIPSQIANALQDAVEIATEKVPTFKNPGTIVICPDVSGSMHSARVTGARDKPTQIRCVDAAALITAALVRKNPDAVVLPFSDRLNLEYKVNPRDSVMTIAEQISHLPSGGTNSALPLMHLNGHNAKGWRATDVSAVFMISDSESWGTNSYYRNTNGGTDMQAAWLTLKKKNPQAKLFCIDLTPNVTAQAENGPDRLNVGGFSDEAWRIFERFMETGSGSSWTDEIERVELDAHRTRV